VTKRAAQARTPERAPGRAARERLLQAGEDLLAERGYEGFTITELARRSGLSNGSIYWLMPSKEILLDAVNLYVIERLEAEAQARSVPELWDGLDLHATLQKCVADLMGVFARNGRILRAFISRAQVDAAVNHRGREQTQRARARFTDAVSRVSGEITHPDPAAAIDLCFRMTASAALQQAILPPSGAADIHALTPQRAAEMAGMFAAYLAPGSVSAAGGSA
jgi:AcrR family transcriptional regulator